MLSISIDYSIQFLLQSYDINSVMIKQNTRMCTADNSCTGKDTDANLANQHGKKLAVRENPKEIPH